MSKTKTAPAKTGDSNRTLFTGDNLLVMKVMAANSVDLIYLDPPFNSKRMYRAPLGSKAAGQAFKDIWSHKDVEMAWHAQLEKADPSLYQMLEHIKGTHSVAMWSFCMYMAVRLIEMERILKPTGSIYLHCDPTASHYLKIVMDSIFGKERYQNEVIWSYNKWTNAANFFQKSNDTILFYAGESRTFNKQYVMTPHKERVLKRGYDSNVVEGGVRQLLVYDFKRTGDRVKEPRYDRVVDMTDKPPGVAAPQVWTDIKYLSSASSERTGWQTQKPLALLERIIKASSNEGDIVFDPFCGCATAMVAAEKLGRQWIGCDLDEAAQEITRDRIAKISDAKVEIRDVRPIEEEKEDPAADMTMEEILFGRQAGVCNLCRNPKSMWDFHNDHIKPQSVGGKDDISNRQLLCGKCNSVKSDGNMKMAVQRIIEHAEAGHLQLGSDFHTFHRKNEWLS